VLTLEKAERAVERRQGEESMEVVKGDQVLLAGLWANRRERATQAAKRGRWGAPEQAEQRRLKEQKQNRTAILDWTRQGH
jgi:hypothetical protein